MYLTTSVECVFLNASRKVETDFTNRFGRVPLASQELGDGQGSSCHPNEVGGREQRRCQAVRVSVEIVWKRTQTLGSDDARNVCINGTARVRDVHTLQSADVETRGEDLIRELLKSLHGTRKAAHNWEKKWQRVIIDSGFVIGTWSPAIVCCRERELCGSVDGDDFIITGDSMQLASADDGDDKDSHDLEPIGDSVLSFWIPKLD